MATAEMGAFSSSPLLPLLSPASPPPPFPSPFPPPPPAEPLPPPPESTSVLASPPSDELGTWRRARRGERRWVFRSAAAAMLLLHVAVRGRAETKRGEVAAGGGMEKLGELPRWLAAPPGLAPPTHEREKACACIAAQRGSRKGREREKRSRGERSARGGEIRRNLLRYLQKERPPTEEKMKKQ